MASSGKHDFSSAPRSIPEWEAMLGFKFLYLLCLRAWEEKENLALVSRGEVAIGGEPQGKQSWRAGVGTKGQALTTSGILFISWGCCKRAACSRWLETGRTCCLTISGARSLKTRCLQSDVSSKPYRGILCIFAASSRVPASLGAYEFAGAQVLSLPSESRGFSLPVLVFIQTSPYRVTSHTGLRSHPIPQWPHLNKLQLWWLYFQRRPHSREYGLDTIWRRYNMQAVTRAPAPGSCSKHGWSGPGKLWYWLLTAGTSDCLNCVNV